MSGVYMGAVHLRLLAILALVVQPLLIGVGLLSAGPGLAGCGGGCVEVAVVTHEDECCGGCCCEDAPPDEPCPAPCCVDVTGEADLTLAVQCACEPGGKCVCPLVAPTQARPVAVKTPTVWAVRGSGDERGPRSDATARHLPVHTRLTLALAPWTLADDPAPPSPDDALDEPACVRQARLCVWTI